MPKEMSDLAGLNRIIPAETVPIKEIADFIWSPISDTRLARRDTATTDTHVLTPSENAGWSVLIADEIIIREVINRIFQEMDSSPDIVGRALMGAFNASCERNKYYRETNWSHDKYIEQEAIKEFMDNVGSKIHCYIGSDEVGTFGDVISTSME